MPSGLPLMNNASAMDTILDHPLRTHATLSAEHAIFMGLSTGDVLWIALGALADQLYTSRTYALPAPGCDISTGFTILLDLAHSGVSLREAPLQTRALTCHPLS